MRRLPKIPWRTLAWLALAGGIVYVVLSPHPDELQPTAAHPVAGDVPAGIAQEIAELGSGSPAVRNRAEQSLVMRGAVAVPFLEAAAIEAEEVERSAILGVLEQLLLVFDLETSDPAETALERLVWNRNRSVAQDAFRVLAENQRLRHARALSLVTARGGKLLTEDNSQMDPKLRDVFLRVLYDAQDAQGVVIDQDWTGGEDGLRYIRRLFPADVLLVFVTAEAPVSEQAVRDFALTRRNMRVRHPQCACLGIMLDDNSPANGVAATTVFRRTPAWNAGLLRNDRIVSMNGSPVRSAFDVYRQLAKFRPGDRVQLTVERRSQRLDIEFALGGDYDTGFCRNVAPKALPPIPEPAVRAPDSVRGDEQAPELTP